MKNGPGGRKIALVLGGGGLRGGAHVGVLRVLAREGVQVGALAGSSIGGLIAAVYAAGLTPDEIKDKLSALEYARLLREPSRAPNALLGLQGVEKVLREVLGERTFGDLNLPLALTALDVRSGREIVLREGSLVDAVMATIAIPGVFPRREFNGWELVDGAMSNPVPVQVARDLAPNLPIVAVPLGPALEQDAETAQAKRSEIDGLPIPSPVMRFRLGQAFLAFLQAMTLSGQIQGEIRLATEKPDVIVRPQVADFGLLDAPDVEQVVLRGEAAAEAALPQLRRTLQPAPLRMLAEWFQRD